MENSKNISQCLATIMSGVDAIKKEKKNQQQGFQYRGIDDIMNSLHAAFAEQGVFIRATQIVTVERVERPTKSGGMMLYSINDYCFAFTAPDGSEIIAWGRGEASDSADKSSNKAVSVALKYVLLQMFLIPTEEMALNEADAYTNEIGTRQQKVATPKVGPAPKKVNDETVAIKVLEAALSAEDLKTRWLTIEPTTQSLETVTAAKDVMKARLSASPRQEPVQ